MRIPNYSSFGYFRMCNKCAFNFSGTKIMTRNNNHIINSPSYPIVTIFVSFTSRFLRARATVSTSR